MIRTALTLAAGQTARLLNLADLASPFQLSRPTIRDHVTLLTRVFLLEELPPWQNNRLSRLVKTFKPHLGDTGLACALLGVDAAALWADRTLPGQLLEIFIFQELRHHASWRDDPITFYHFRDKDGAEADIVLKGVVCCANTRPVGWHLMDFRIADTLTDSLRSSNESCQSRHGLPQTGKGAEQEYPVDAGE